MVGKRSPATKLTSYGPASARSRAVQTLRPWTSHQPEMPMANLSRLMPAAKFRIKRAILAANYRLGNYRERLWLIGDGRSGTTWAANLLNHRGRYRQLFEPFHPQMVSAASF